MTTYDTLREANVARQKEWDSGNQITLAYRGNELAGEVGEACNIIKKLERERLGIRGSRATVEQLAEELADIVICTDLVAMSEGIDLNAAIAAKFNATSEKVGLSTRITAALSAAPEAVRVKELEWVGNEVYTPVGHYRVQRLDDKWEPLRDYYYMLPKEHGVVVVFGTPQEAMAYCFDDYEARILSALATTEASE